MKKKLKREILKCNWCGKPFEDEFGNILDNAKDHYEYCGKSVCDKYLRGEK